MRRCTPGASGRIFSIGSRYCRFTSCHWPNAVTILRSWPRLRVPRRAGGTTFHGSNFRTLRSTQQRQRSGPVARPLAAQPRRGRHAPPGLHIPSALPARSRGDLCTGAESRHQAAPSRTTIPLRQGRRQRCAPCPGDVAAAEYESHGEASPARPPRQAEASARRPAILNVHPPPRTPRRSSQYRVAT